MSISGQRDYFQQSGHYFQDWAARVLITILNGITVFRSCAFKPTHTAISQSETCFKCLGHWNFGDVQGQFPIRNQICKYPAPIEGYSSFTDPLCLRRTHINIYHITKLEKLSARKMSEQERVLAQGLQDSPHGMTANLR